MFISIVSIMLRQSYEKIDKNTMKYETVAETRKTLL